MTFLPTPAPPGATPGEPGHFAHHGWLEDSVRALDTGPGSLLVLSQTAQQTVPSDAWTTLRLHEMIAQSGEWDYTLNPFGAVKCGPAWVPGWYRVDYSAGFAGTSSASSRALRIEVNSASPSTLPNLIQGPSGNDTARPWANGGGGFVHLLPDDILGIAIRHRDAAPLETNPASSQLAIALHYPAATPL